ncbi:MAG: tetratricopeptide repeat protein [Saprospiraceae bacterium]
MARSYNNLGLIYQNQRSYDIAIPYHDSAFSIRQKALPIYHEDLIGNYFNLGLCNIGIQNFDEALHWIKEGIESDSISKLKLDNFQNSISNYFTTKLQS